MDNILLFTLPFIIKREAGKELNVSQSRQKIKLMKKIGPYFPPEYIGPINTALVFTEKFLHLYESINFVNSPTINYIEKSIPLDTNKERVHYIINTIRDETKKEDVENMGLVLDLIVNMEKYKKLLDLFTSLISQPDSLNDPSQIINLIEPLMEGRPEEERKKIREMAQILGMMQKLDEDK